MSLVAPVFADWTDYDYVWFEGWNKRQVLRVDQTAGAGTNYELKINVTWTEDYRSDFKDLRITYLNGTDLKWWIEQLVSDSFCALWLKVPVDLDSESFDCFWWSQNPIADTYYNSSATDVFKRVISSGVILALPMNEGSGTALIDYSGNGNDGAFAAGASAPSWVTTGKYGNGVSFDGSDDYVDLSNVATWDLAATAQTTGLTFVFWFQANSTTGDDYAALIYRYTSGQGVSVWVRNTANGGRLTFIHEATTNDASKTSTASVADGVTRSVFSVMDADTNNADLYLDNVAQGAADVWTDDLIDRNANMYLGGGGTSVSWKGILSYALILGYDVVVAERADFQAYYPQCSSANLGSLFLRTYVSGGVSYGFIVMEDTSNMDYIYLVGLLGVIGVSLVLFKLKLGVVGLVWGIFGIAIAASLAGNQTVAFYPYLTLGVAVVGTLLVLYSGYEMRGAS